LWLRADKPTAYIVNNGNGNHSRKSPEGRVAGNDDDFWQRMSWGRQRNDCFQTCSSITAESGRLLHNNRDVNLADILFTQGHRWPNSRLFILGVGFFIMTAGSILRQCFDRTLADVVKGLWSISLRASPTGFIAT